MYAGRFPGYYNLGPAFRRIDLYTGERNAAPELGGVTIGKAGLLHTGLGPASATPGDARESYALRAYPIRTVGDVACGPLPPSGTLVECPAWVTAPLDLEPGSAPVVDSVHDRVYVGVNHEGIRAFDQNTGAELWRGAPASVALATRTPALAGGLLYAGTGTGVAVYDAAGCGAPTCPPLWQSGPAPSGEGSPGQAEQGPAVAGGVVFVPVMAPGGQPRLVAFDAHGCGQERCEPIWGMDLPGHVVGELAISGGKIYVPTDQGLVALGL